MLTPKRDIEPQGARDGARRCSSPSSTRRTRSSSSTSTPSTSGRARTACRPRVERFFLHTGIYGLTLPTPLAELSVGQAALLAGVISNPEGNNPFFQPERAKARRSFALERMVSSTSSRRSRPPPPSYEPLPTILPTADLRPRNAWAEEVQDQLVSDDRFDALGATRKDREHRVLTGGLQHRHDARPRPAGQGAVRHRPELPPKSQGSPARCRDGPEDRASEGDGRRPRVRAEPVQHRHEHAGRQAGSTWKVITLAAALESGISPNDRRRAPHRARSACSAHPERRGRRAAR